MIGVATGRDLVWQQIQLNVVPKLLYVLCKILVALRAVTAINEL